MIPLIIELREHLGEEGKAIAPNSLLSHYSFTDVLSFKQSKGKKGRSCNPQKSFPCGRSCQPKKNKDGSDRNCRNPLEGQAKTAAEWLKSQGDNLSGESSNSQAESKSDSDKSDFIDPQVYEKEGAVLGRGTQGTVYRDEGPPPAAVKYMLRVKAEDFPDLPPEIVAENLATNEEVLQQEIEGIRRTGELGIAPKLYKSGTFEGDLDYSVLSMEMLDGYIEMDPNSSEEEIELSDEQTSQVYTSLLKRVKTAHDNKIFLDDVKEDNIMMNLDTGDVKFIDQGGAQFDSSSRQIAAQLLDRFDGGEISSRPMLAGTVSSFIENNGSKEDKKAFKKIVKKFEKAYTLEGSDLSDSLEAELFGAKKDLSDSEYQGLVDQTYEILGRLGI